MPTVHEHCIRMLVATNEAGVFRLRLVAQNFLCILYRVFNSWGPGYNFFNFDYGLLFDKFERFGSL
jgi:hypothetical protein